MNKEKNILKGERRRIIFQIRKEEKEKIVEIIEGMWEHHIDGEGAKHENVYLNKNELLKELKTN